MAQKKKKNKSVSSNRPVANTKAKKSIVITKKAYLSSQIITDNGVEATQKFNLSSQMITENGTQKFNLSRCQHKKKKKKKKKSVQIRKGKSIVKPSNDQVMTIYFQEEIMMDILSRLPVRSLLRFKCVSKFWNSLIIDPYFKRTHYIFHSQNSQKLLIGKKCFGKDDAFNFYTCSLSTVQLVEDVQKLDWPLSCKPKHVSIFCSCDGLVLIFFSSKIRHQELLLWNPSTRESILLPHPQFPVIHYVYGLVYDATSEDYKILAINLNAGQSFDISIELLSLKSASWRRIGYPTGIQRVRGFRDCGMDYLPFLHGAFHWLVKSLSGYYTTVSFNISNEMYGEVPLLEQMYDVFPYFFIDRGVSVLRGMLCFYSTCNNGTEGVEGTFKLWVMKEYGVRESWTKLIKIRDNYLFYSGRPKYMFADGEVLLHCRRIGCATSKFTTSRGPFRLCPQCNTMKHGIVYAERFVSPKSLT